MIDLPLILMNAKRRKHVSVLNAVARIHREAMSAPVAVRGLQEFTTCEGINAVQRVVRDKSSKNRLFKKQDGLRNITGTIFIEMRTSLSIVGDSKPFVEGKFLARSASRANGMPTRFLRKIERHYTVLSDSDMICSLIHGLKMVV
ncbi:hypothetical protein Tco_0959547 [Tanacetum coccineum]